MEYLKRKACADSLLSPGSHVRQELVDRNGEGNLVHLHPRSYARQEVVDRNVGGCFIHHRSHNTPDLADFTREDMLQLYAEFIEGPERPSQLYDVHHGSLSSLFCI